MTAPREIAGKPLLLAIIVPFVTQAILITLERWLPGRMPWEGNFVSLWISTAAGLLVLAVRFRFYSIVIAVVYIPLMIPALVVFSLSLVGLIWDDYL